jgi:hypothetical protein
MQHIKETERKVYTTTDGVEFNEKLAAIGHQAQIDAEPVIDLFIEERHGEATERGKKSMRKTLGDWVAYEAVEAAQDKPSSVPATDTAHATAA